jgi:uncharacterized protein (TIGR02996 family)
MTDRFDLLRAVARHPDDDTPRLICADWLDEQGNDRDSARAEFIRLQIDLDHDPPRVNMIDWAPDPRSRRERELVTRFGAAWLASELPAWAAHQLRQCHGWPDEPFTRGFVEFARFHPCSFVLHGHELFTLAPLTGADLGVKDLDTLYLLAGCPHLARLRSLDVSGGRVGVIGIGDDGVEILALSPYLAGLEELDLSCAGITDAGAAILAQSTRLPGLQVLDVSRNQLTPNGVEALLDSPNFPDLDTLELGSDYSGVVWLPRMRERFPDRLILV